MQKAYGSGQQATEAAMAHGYHHGYYPDVGYNPKYDHASMVSAYNNAYGGNCSPIGDPNALGGYYHHQTTCAIQGPLGMGGPNSVSGDPSCGGMGENGGVYDPSGYPNPCAIQGQGCPPGLGPLHPGMGSKQHEIYPWMKESRQNNKQRQAQVTGEIQVQPGHLHVM